MNKNKKQFALWSAIAGVIFIIVWLNDAILIDVVSKSTFMLALELIAGVVFLLNAFLIWKKKDN